MAAQGPPSLNQPLHLQAWKSRAAALAGESTYTGDYHTQALASSLGYTPAMTLLQPRKSGPQNYINFTDSTTSAATYTAHPTLPPHSGTKVPASSAKVPQRPMLGHTVYQDCYNARASTKAATDAAADIHGSTGLSQKARGMLAPGRMFADETTYGKYHSHSCTPASFGASGGVCTGPGQHSPCVVGSESQENGWGEAGTEGDGLGQAGRNIGPGELPSGSVPMMDTSTYTYDPLPRSDVLASSSVSIHTSQHLSTARCAVCTACKSKQTLVLAVTS